jgi:hypothetical protein
MRERTNMKKALAALSLLLTAAYASGAAAAGDQLIFEDYLFPGQQLVASGCYYRAIMQTDGNFVNYGGNRSRWASNTANAGGYAVMQTDGNFVIYNWADRAVWSTHTISHSPGASWLSMQSDGNLVMYEFNHGAVWSTRTAGEAVGQSPCQYKAEHTTVIVNADRPGSDYKVLIPNEARASWCGFFCAAETACKAYTYIPPTGAGTGECHLKNAVPSRVSRAGRVSGVKQF